MGIKYRFAVERQDYSDYASGQVFYGAPGQPTLPVRLVSEIFQRCLAIRQVDGAIEPCTLYDPCCGGAYHLGTLAYLHWETIDMIIGSDVDQEALSFAACNLSLLTLAGLDKRISELSAMLTAFGKASHAQALESARGFRQRLQNRVEVRQVRTHLFHADALDGATLRKGLGGQRIDKKIGVVLTDVPYGQWSAWQVVHGNQGTTSNPVDQMLDALVPVLTPEAVVAVVADKQQKIRHEGYRRVERFQVGKRRIVILKAV